MNDSNCPACNSQSVKFWESGMNLECFYCGYTCEYIQSYGDLVPLEEYIIETDPVKKVQYFIINNHQTQTTTVKPRFGSRSLGHRFPMIDILNKQSRINAIVKYKMVAIMK